MWKIKSVVNVWSDIVYNVLTGSYDKGTSTSVERTNARLKNCADCADNVLSAVVGPGDLLSSELRAEFAAEVYFAWGTCPGCNVIALKNKRLAKSAQLSHAEVKHDFVTAGPFKEMAHVIANHQRTLDERFFNSMVERLRVLQAEEKLSSDSEELGEDDLKAMAVELVLVASMCVGIRAYYAALGLKAPPFKSMPVSCQPGHFQRVSEYSTSPLQTNRSIAWSPTLPTSQLRTDVTDKFRIDRSLWRVAGDNPDGPLSKASVAPLTCWEFLKFANAMYVPLAFFFRFLKVPGEDRTLSRGQLEVAAASYTTAKACNF
eukprot:TRINITY_DN73018_c0_g1_i1.p1 TRINITY_DN73018_c0_g1~~TRINITY_DN73018_c0_g1_i1.p1  ORF type:complete len:317 (+),score=47.24 TRINITY_DN73018_c0_g1_i1:169-1119(+)